VDSEGKSAAPPVHLIVKLELPGKPAREFSYDFRQEVITLGRDPGNDIQVPLTTVSRRHSRIFYELGDYFLEDLGSTHGTEHNGIKLAPREKKLLRDGDSVRVMSFSIIFKTTSGTMLDRLPGEKTEQLARRMVQEVLASLGGGDAEPPALRVMNGSDEGRRFDISDDQAEITIGRSPECDIALNDQNISRRHCLIKRTWNGFTAQDLGSKNGVLLNGTKIEGAANMKDGDEVQIGGIKLIFLDPASRILDQFGVLQDETNDGRGTASPQAIQEGEGEGEAPQEEPPPEEPSAEPSPEPEAAAPPEGGGEDPAPDGIEPGMEGGDIALGDDGEMPVTKGGLGAEVVILVIGGLVLLGAIAVAVFLYL
jgi:pSer/pThr/pTyr-binding forkhead associated (FHA) protein